MFKDHTYVFGKIPEEYREADFNDEYYFKFTINEETECVHLEDTCGRSVPVDFTALHDMHTALTKLIVGMQTQLIGAKTLGQV